MNTILTGHKGLIGSFLKKRLEEEGHKIVHGIDIREGKNILDIDNLELKDRIDLMIHAAAHCKINQAIKNPALAYSNNAKGTFKVLEFCRVRLKRT